MKWFAKYWLLKKRYDLLLLQFNELKHLIDEEFWKKEDYNV